MQKRIKVKKARIEKGEKEKSTVVATVLKPDTQSKMVTFSSITEEIVGIQDNTPSMEDKTSTDSRIDKQGRNDDTAISMGTRNDSNVLMNDSAHQDSLFSFFSQQQRNMHARVNHMHSERRTQRVNNRSEGEDVRSVVCTGDTKPWDLKVKSILIDLTDERVVVESEVLNVYKVNTEESTSVSSENSVDSDGSSTVAP